jgi:PAS domain S-box-containing protein
MIFPDNGPATWDSQARTLHRAALAAARPPSAGLFDALVQEMAASLGAALGLIGVFTDETCTRVRTVAARLDGKALAPFEYTLAGTPCEQVVGSEFKHVVGGVAAQYGATSFFAHKGGMDSYAAYPLLDSHGERLGLLAAMDRAPLTDVALAEAVLKILGSRIAAELERTTTEDVLKTAALAVSSARGDAVFAELVRSLGEILHVDAAFIARPSASDPGTMDVLAMRLDGLPVEIDSYAVATSPCAGVLRDGFRVYPDRLGQRFPDEPMLRTHDIEAYAGYPLTDLTGRTLGLVSIASRAPLRRLDRIESVMQIFAVRAAAEIERLRAEEALRLREEQYRAVFEASSDAFVLHNAKLDIIDVNPAFLQLYGWTREQAATFRRYPETYPPGYVAERHERIQRALRGEESHVETIALRPDGTSFEADLRVIPLRYRGEPHVLSIARDITERRQRERELQRSEARLRATVEAGFDSIIGMDGEGRIVEFNAAAERCFGHERSAVLGRLLAEVIIPERLRGSHIEGLGNFAPTGSGPFVGRLFETTAQRADGSEFPVEIAIGVAVAPDGNIYVGHLRDITARRQAESRRAELEGQLRQAQKMEAIGHLTGGIAHDFNNILTSVTGYIVLASERAERLGAADLVRQLGQAHLAAQRARDLISQMLAFARRQRSERRPLALAAELRQSAQLLRSTLPSSIELHTALDAHAAAVVGDSVQIEQVLFNLCINARDAIRGAGAIRIGLDSAAVEGVCASCRASVRGRWVVLSVADNGSGVSEAVRERMFEPFYTTKPVGSGSGMGLAMVHGIVHDHGGHLLVDPVEPRGTSFRVLLPPAQSAPEGAVPGGLEPAAGCALAGRVLLVEDEAMVAAFVSELLGGWSLEVVHCGDPLDVEELLRRGAAFDVVLTDQTMPGLTGLELAARLATTWPELPVLLYSGFGEGIDAAELARSGVRALLRKPIDPEALRSALAESLGVSA